MQLFHFWSRDVHSVQNLLLCTKFHENEISWFFTMIWRCISFQNGGRPPSWNRFTIIRDHPRSLCCWLQLPVTISCQSDTQVWRYSYLNFLHIWLEMPIQAPKVEVLGVLWTPKCDYSSSRLSKGTSLRKSASLKLSTVKIHWGVWPVGEHKAGRMYSIG